MFPLVSILIPCYNSEKYIGDTIQSCIAQKYSNVEVIIVDNGSADKSIEIAEAWASRCDNIHLYTQQNSGVCRARNLAFSKSARNYILYLDTDDLKPVIIGDGCWLGERCSILKGTTLGIVQ